MEHSNQVREFLMTSKGLDLIDVYVGNEQVLTGTARVAQEMREKALADAGRQDKERRSRQLANELKTIEARIAALKAEALAASQEAEFINTREDLKMEDTALSTKTMSRLRDRSKRDRGPDLKVKA
jgi:circadian clock protein KaiC